MAEEFARVMVPAGAARRWVVIAKLPDGSLTDLTKRLGRTFPPAASREEQFERIRQQIEENRSFALHFAGATFFLADAYAAIRCTPLAAAVS